jgi:hypothetical protein
VLAACGGGSDTVSTPSGASSLRVTSAAFEDGGAVPAEYSCKGEDVSPPLKWSNVPAGAKSLAIIVDDPDADGFVHWLAWGISPKSTEVKRAASGALPDAAKEGSNGFGNTAYGGPCPPGGSTHNYRFRVFALDTSLTLDAGAGAKDLIGAMEGHIIATGELHGTFGG